MSPTEFFLKGNDKDYTTYRKIDKERGVFYSNNIRTATPFNIKPTNFVYIDEEVKK